MPIVDTPRPGYDEDYLGVYYTGCGIKTGPRTTGRNEEFAKRNNTMLKNCEQSFILSSSVPVVAGKCGFLNCVVFSLFSQSAKREFLGRHKT